MQIPTGAGLTCKRRQWFHLSDILDQSYLTQAVTWRHITQGNVQFFVCWGVTQTESHIFTFLWVQAGIWAGGGSAGSSSSLPPVSAHCLESSFPAETRLFWSLGVSLLCCAIPPVPPHRHLPILPKMMGWTCVCVPLESSGLWQDPGCHCSHSYHPSAPIHSQLHPMP